MTPKNEGPCSVCKGACCEYMVLNVDHLRPDVQKWFEYHGEEYAGVASRLDTKNMIIDQQCLQLTMNGKCGIYKSRPEICKALKPGSKMCVEAIERQRDPEQAKLIMEAINDG